jgi:hypothetical protein
MMVFAVPALLALSIAVIHVVAGGRDVARPLLQQQTLPPSVRLTLYYCWHIATISLAVLAGCYAYAAVSPEGRILAALATLVSSAFCVWGLVLVLWKRQRHRDMPQWILFLGLTGSGVWALAA